MATKVNWNRPVPPPPRTLYFEDLAVNQAFRNKHGRGAVYIKVEFKPHGVHKKLHLMYEVETGNLWEPTTSAVELVDVELNVSVPKPPLYARKGY